MAIVLLFVAAIPLCLSVAALLDAARRPQWAWALANRSQLAWLGAIAFGLFIVVGGLAIASWYLVRVRPEIAAVEAGDFGSLRDTTSTDD